MRLFSCAMLLAFAAAETPYAEIDKQQLLDLIGRGENAIQNFSFTLDLAMSKKAADGSFRPEKYSMRIEGMLGRGAETCYNTHTVARVSTVENGRLADTGEPVEAAGSFDGKTSRSLFYSKDSGDAFVPETGILAAGENYNHIMLFGSGMELVLPFFCRLGLLNTDISSPRGLAYYLKHLPPEAGEWTVESTDSPGIVRIGIPYPGTQGRVWDLLELDLSRGAAITKYQLWLNYGSSKASIGDEAICELQEFDGVWLPVRIEDTNPPYRSNVRIVYANVNSVLEENAFVLDWPAGISVSDEIAGVVYPVGISETARKEILTDSLQTFTDARLADSPMESRSKPQGSPGAGDAAPVEIQRSNAGSTVLAAAATGLAFSVAVAGWLFRKRPPAQ